MQFNILQALLFLSFFLETGNQEAINNTDTKTTTTLIKALEILLLVAYY